MAWGVSEEKSGRSREINGESSASRRSIFKTTKSKERKQIQYHHYGMT
ncbi:hypothetical protein [Mesotoga sp.]